ncbi:MAG: phosphatase PAP2 family protein [Rhodoferax sp.]
MVRQIADNRRHSLYTALYTALFSITPAPAPATLNPAPAAVPTPALFVWVLALSLVLALVPTLWPALDLAVARLFAGPGAAGDAVAWFWVEGINRFVPALFRGVVLLALGAWLLASLTRFARRWRLQLAFLVLAGALGPGLVVNSGFKEQWQRARPYQVEQFGGTQKFTRATVMTDQCDNNCSFVSGHVACGVFLVSWMLVQPRRQRRWAAIGIAAGLLIGFARMADNAHWLSDVLWACPITLACSWLVWRVVLRLYPPTANPSSTDG